MRRKKKPVVFEDDLPKLNAILPPFGAQLELFPDVSQVQNPLQNIFREYIECYITMLLQLASHPPCRHAVPSRVVEVLTKLALSFQEFRDRLDPARELFNDSRREWQEMVAKAQEDQKNKLASSIASFPRNSLGHRYPYAPSRTSFELVEILGHGTFGDVFKVRQPTTNRIYAQKVIRVPEPGLRARIEKQVENEVSVMDRLMHHHISSLCFYMKDEESLTHSIFMHPVADYNLLQFLLRKGGSEGLSRAERTHLTTWFGCLISALAFAHVQHIKHEDIKPNNILIKDYQPYLADFGCAQDFSDLPGSTSTDILAFDTPAYSAPEPPADRGRTADVFSLGCVFSEMLTVRQGRSLDEYQQFRRKEGVDNPFAFRENLGKVHEWLEKLSPKKDDVMDLLIEVTQQMLQGKKTQRPEARDVKRQLRTEIEAVFCNSCQ